MRPFPKKLYFPRTANWKREENDSARMCYEEKIDALTYRHTEWVAEYRLVNVRRYHWSMKEVR